MEINKLEKRVFEISYKHKLSHVGSCITAVNIIDRIYQIKKEEDIFILSSGHAGLALYVVLEKCYGFDAEQLYLKHGVHPNKDLKDKIYCSTGSLGQGITIAIGRALANPCRCVYVLCSDGETYEGSFWESLRFIEENNVRNIFILINVNNYSAYRKLNGRQLEESLMFFGGPLGTLNYNLDLFKTYFHEFDFLHGIDAHYHILTDEEWEKIKDA